MSFSLPPGALDRELVFEFFWKFSVFECALKRRSFLAKGRDGVAEADWYNFGQAITGQFATVSTPGFPDAVKELVTLAPNRQVVRSGKRLGWEPVPRKPTDSEESYTLRLLKTVRNNLFHGGKYPDGSIEEIARNREILQAALAVLDACYELHDGIRSQIDEAA